MQVADGRDKLIDGFRGLAVAGVLFGHAANYRYADAFEAHGKFTHQLIRFAGPLADGGVSLFFAISGFIITTLLLREEARRGGIGVAEFYVRRVFRILPPFILFMGSLWLLARTGWIVLPSAQVLNASLFTCNTGLTECSWFVAHTWSLAVEEQFYLTWPIFLAFAPAKWRLSFVVVAIAVLLIAHLIQPFAWHGNPVSFACIAAGAACALQPRWSEQLEQWGSPLKVALAFCIALAGPLVLPMKLFQAAVPLLAVFVLFGSRRVAAAHFVLGSRIFQTLGTLSYGLYLWQQLFLGPAERYPNGMPPIWLLPLVTVTSLFALERPMIRMGQRFSKVISEVR